MWTAETALVCALTLLSQSAESFPPIRFVETRPAHVSATAEGYVVPNEARIYMITTSSVFTAARRVVDRCGNHQAIRKIASILVHEEWHVRHGSDESGAYAAQLMALTYLNAGPGNPLYYDVTRSMQAATRAHRTAHAARAAMLAQNVTR